MITITIGRTVVEQALEVINDTVYGAPVFRQEVRDALTALRAALAQQAEPVDTDCHTQGICQRSGYGIGKQAEPVEPVYWEVRCTAHPKWMRVDEQQFDEYVANGWEGQRLYTALAQEQAEPLTIERLRDALVASRIIQPAAVEDPEEYDDGVTLHRIEALHRRIT